MEIKVVKTSIVRLETDKEGKKKSPKYLWAFIDKYNHTVIQIYSEEYPKKLYEIFTKSKNEET